MTIDSEGKIKSVEFYNSKGDILKSGNSSIDKIDREYFYDTLNKLTEERTYNDKGDIWSVYKYYYNDKGQLIKRENIQFGNIEATWTYEYDEKGNKQTEKLESGTMGNTVTKYKYDANSNLIQEDKANETIGKEERVTYKYSDKVQLIEKRTKAYYFNTTIILTYLYNNKGQLDKLIEKSSNGVSSKTIFEYDEKGLLSSDIWESSISKIPNKTTYKINFQ